MQRSDSIMTTIKTELGVQDTMYMIQHFDPSVYIEIRGDHALALEVLEYLEKFESLAGQIEVR